MKYTVWVLVQGYAYAEVEANNNEEALRKAMELEHENFKINIEELDYDSSPKYREVWDENGNEV